MGAEKQTFVVGEGLLEILKDRESPVRRRPLERK